MTRTDFHRTWGGLRTQLAPGGDRRSVTVTFDYGGELRTLVAPSRKLAFAEASADDVEFLYRLNVVTPVELSRQALGGMLQRGRGHIVNVSSLAGVGPFPGMAMYASSKAALNQFTAALRADLKGTPVGTTLVELGYGIWVVSADLYVELITDFIREVSGYPANVIASSLGAAYAIRVADEHCRQRSGAEQPEPGE